MAIRGDWVDWVGALGWREMKWSPENPHITFVRKEDLCRRGTYAKAHSTLCTVQQPMRRMHGGVLHKLVVKRSTPDYPSTCSKLNL